MSEAPNPFEAPRFDDPRAQPRGRIDPGAAVGAAARAAFSDIGVVLMGSLIFVSLSLASAVTGIGLLVFLPVLMWGWTRLLLNLIDGIAGYTDLGDGFGRYGSVLARMFLLGLLLLVIASPFMGLIASAWILENEALLFAGQGTMFLTWLLLVPRVAFAPFVLVDQDLGPTEAITVSWATTADQKLPALLLTVMATFVAAIGLGCFVISVVALPIAGAAYAAAYRQLFPKA